MVEFYLLTFPRFPLRKKEHKSYFGKNRTGCKDKISSWHLNGFPDGIIVTLDQQYSVGEKPTVILYPYINRHAGTAKQNKNNVVYTSN